MNEKKAIFFDRDGVLNHDSGYIYKIEDFKWMNGAKDAIKFFNNQGWLVFVVTNQSGIARGFYSEDDLNKLHLWVQQDLNLMGAYIDAFEYCPHHPEAKLEPLRLKCLCRKPEAGMITKLLAKWQLKPENCMLIGDKSSDLQAGAGAGVKSFLFKAQENDNLLTFVKKNIFQQS